MPGPALFLTLDYPPMVGGVANYYSQLVKHLPPDVVVVVDNHKQALTRPWLKTWFVLRRYRRSHHFRAIIVGQVLPLGTIAWLWRAVFKTPYVVYTHGMDITVPQRFWRKRVLLRRILRSATFIVTVSQYSQNQLQALVPEGHWKKIVLIPPGPTITPQVILKPITQQLPNDFILSVGRLVKRKGFDLMIQALTQLPKSLDTWHYVIAGAGPEYQALKELAGELNLTHRVHFFDQPTDVMLAQLYQQCRFLVMPARNLAGDFEGFGTVILEANSFAKPAIGSLAGGMPDAIIAEHTGLLVPPDNVMALAEASTRLAMNTSWCQQLGEQAQKYVREHHQWSTKAQQFHALLKQL